MQVQDTALRDALRSDDCAEQIEAVQLAAKQRREDLLPDLLRLLPSDHVGYFVEEVLPGFGEPVRQPLRAILHDPLSSEGAQLRAAGILARFGEAEAIPVLLQAIGREEVNQSYFPLLAQHAPEALARRLLGLVEERSLDMLAVTEPRRADYLAKLLLFLRDVGGQDAIRPLLARLSTDAQHWLVRAAAGAALAP